jgi:DNA-directed RNA polymerase specialized sigma24 family protein
MSGKEAQILPNPDPYNLHELYDKYSGMLFGYIYEVVKDVKLAEKYLAGFFADIPKHIHEINTGGTSTWCQLQRMAKRYLSNSFTDQNNDNQVSVVAGNGSSNNRFLGMMTEEQREVFYNMYYNGKSATELSIALNKPVETIRKSLKEAFLILKQGK